MTCTCCNARAYVGPDVLREERDIAAEPERIPSRLRYAADWYGTRLRSKWNYTAALLRVAAEEVERLRARVKELESKPDGALGYAIVATSTTGYVWLPTIPGATTIHHSIGVVQDALTATGAENYTLCALVPVEES